MDEKIMMELTCTIEGCNKLIRIKKFGLCQMHETRFRNHGDPCYERKIADPIQCKIEDCKGIVYNKSNQLCMKHYQQFWKYGDPLHKSNRKSLTPLKIPGGEVVTNYSKAKKIVTIISILEKMIMCGYIDNHFSFSKECFKLIGEYRHSKAWFYDQYIYPILNTKEFFIEYWPMSETISNLVDEIIEKGKAINDDIALSWRNLESFGITHQKNEYYFMSSDKDIGKRVTELNIDLDNDQDYEICFKLKIHYRRYKKLTNKE